MKFDRHMKARVARAAADQAAASLRADGFHVEVQQTGQALQVRLRVKIWPGDRSPDYLIVQIKSEV